MNKSEEKERYYKIQEDIAEATEVLASVATKVGVTDKELDAVIYTILRELKII